MAYTRILKTIMVMALALTGLPAASYADDYPTDGRIKILRYDANDIYTIYTLYGYQTNIEFGKNEEIQTISVGERSLWQIIPSGSRIFIRPMDDDVTTNMTVITNARTYQFDLKSGSGALEENPRLVYVARFVYPDKQTIAPPVLMPQAAAQMAVPAQPESPYRPLLTLPPAEPQTSITPARPVALAAAPAAAPPAPAAPPPVTRMTAIVPPASAAPKPSDHMQPLQLPQNYLYTYTGPDALAPVQVYDDGRSTFLRFDENIQRLPDIFLMDNQGNLTSARPSLKEGFVVVNSVVPRMVLSYADGSKESVYVYNETMNPGDIGHGQ